MLMAKIKNDFICSSWLLEGKLGVGKNIQAYFGEHCSKQDYLE